MKIFIGRSKTVWMVSPKTGTVRKLPLSLFGLFSWFFISITVGIGSVSYLMSQSKNYNKLERSTQAIAIADAVDRRTRDLGQTMARLRKEREGSKKYAAQIEDTLKNLESILGSLTTATAKTAAASGPKEVKKVSYQPSREDETLLKLDKLESDLITLPLQLPVKNGMVTSKYGYRSSIVGENSHFHRGIDISFRGTSNNVFAAGDGVVKTVGVMNGYGLYVDLQHSNDVITRYAHLQASQVQVGQKVHAGQFIAFGGSTGRATGAHLHYEVWVRGSPRDPEQFLELPKKIQMVLGSQPLTKG